MTKQAELLTAGDVAKLTGVTPAAVRYWGEKGRLSVIRTAGGVRLYDRGEVERLAAERLAARAAR
jgi:DNA-binding transcriptional MerR regulator